MEIVGTDMEQKERKSKKLMILISVLIVVLLIISIILFLAINYLKSKQFKLKVDDKTISSYSEDLFIFKDGQAYVSLRDVASLIGYKFYNGGYKQYSEDTNKCYLESDNEITTFERDSNKVYKTPNGEIDYTYYTLNEPVTRINGKLYIDSEDLGLACNLQIQYSEEKNSVTVYTLPYIASYYTRTYTNSAVSSNFNNQKALLYGLLVVQSVDNTDNNSNAREIRYGINNLQNEEIVGMKYTNIEFIEGTEEFIVTTEENKVGLITSTGDTRVTPQYDALKQIDKDLNLYLATTNGRNGIIERNGKILIYLEYDQIGVDTTQFQSNDIKNKYILFNNAIPVKQNGKWGLFNIEGQQILPTEYDNMGCVTRTSSNKNLNNILIIPEIEGIVVGQELEQDSKKVTQYGIVSSTGRSLVRVCLDTIYSLTVSGQEQYTMIYQGNSIDVIDYIKEWVPDYNQDKTSNEETQEDENNVIANEVTTETSTTQVVNQEEQQTETINQENQTVTETQSETETTSENTIETTVVTEN